MPFTPFHMGPGIAIKALLQGSFSVMVFGWTQILMDIQPLVVLITGEGHLHGFSHTFVGGSIIAVISALTGKYLSELGLSILGIDKGKRINIAWWVVFLSAYIGVFSHVLLDAVMHSDVEPFYPFNTDNVFLGYLSYAGIHKLCVYSGIFGGVVYFLINHKKLKS